MVALGLSSRDDLGAGLHICGLGTRPCTCDLGIGLHSKHSGLCDNSM